MAAPPETTLRDLSSTFVLNSTLSDDADQVLSLQGVGWLTRKALKIATITLKIKQYTDEAGIVHVDTEQTATGGISGAPELRALDWTLRPSDDSTFGKRQVRARWVHTHALEEPYLKEGWLDGEEEKAGPGGELHVETDTVADNGWTARVVWGFSTVDGKRYYTRRVVVKKGNKEEKARLVYDFQGK